MDNKKENKKRQRVLPTQMNLIIHIVAGGYLLYLAYSIYMEIGTAAGGKKIGLGLAIIVFVAVGATVAFSALRSLKRGEYRGGAADPDGGDGENGTEGTEENTEKEPTQQRIHFDETDVIPERLESMEKKEEKE